MRVTYIVESLDELAEHFDKLALEADAKALTRGPKPKDGNAPRFSVAGNAWREAARILRNVRVEPSSP